MNIAPDRTAFDASLLDAEWARIDLMLCVAEARRTGGNLGDEFSAAFEKVGQQVSAARQSGGWLGLRSIVSEDVLRSFVQLDLDVLALVLAPEARPSFATRIQSLQPHVSSAHPSLALLEELLLLDDSVAIGALFGRLAPHAPLGASGCTRVAGSGAYQTISPGPQVAKALLGRSIDLGPPPGAHLVTTAATWADLVLPDMAHRSLKDFLAWVRHRDSIITQWGARSMGGPLALFCGPSGSGKSFAATVIAAELTRQTGEPWALYALDLGRIMSKYIGETEQNLNALLDALDGRRAILQIDEADGLLGKRGEVSDARDRYANLEVSHMLSRFERHAGPVILTTNLRTNIDAAFLRRFQQIVDFPSPDTAARKLLWEKLLPPHAPRAGNLDAPQLASTVRLSGGGIHNAAFFAAVLAKQDEQPIAANHLARAVWAELNKDNRQVRRTELGALAEHLDVAA